jgi:hypothetical protein
MTWHARRTCVEVFEHRILTGELGVHRASQLLEPADRASQLAECLLLLGVLDLWHGQRKGRESTLGTALAGNAAATGKSEGNAARVWLKPAPFGRGARRAAWLAVARARAGMAHLLQGCV